MAPLNSSRGVPEFVLGPPLAHGPFGLFSPSGQRHFVRSLSEVDSLASIANVRHGHSRHCMMITGLPPGGWRVEGGGWRVEGGGLRVEGGGWKVEGGGWMLNACATLYSAGVHGHGRGRSASVCMCRVGSACECEIVLCKTHRSRYSGKTV